ncbi:putative disease resistance protein [Senna tora]|uniref:Putative disease resistance protein n=1 Tax=Senna tora TaxID=362788 RepID=A0A834TVT2_9FABA|nr:putative disease resistance protein [Senna tora]
MLLGAAVGAVVGELLKAILDTKDRAVQFRPTLDRLASTLRSIEPVIEQIERYNRQLDRPKEETEKLIQDLKNGKKLVLKCSEIQWWKCCFRPHYQQELEALDESLKRFFNIDLQVQMARDQKETLVEVKEIHMQVKKLNMVARNDRIEIRGLCSAPQPPPFTVGLDVPLMKLKVRLLQDGVSVLVVTGSAGSGKTTLAKMICWDEDVKGKFKDNIFYVNFSKTPNLNIIVQKLFQHNGYQVPDLQDEEDAVNQLERLLKLIIGKSPILLVLDDVWQRSESLVDNLVFQMSDLKILVTSRFAIQRFSTPLSLKPLDNEEDAMKLLRHAAKLNESRSAVPEDVVRKIVRGCSGSPLALKAIGRSLCQQDPVVWESRATELSEGQPIFDSNEDLLACLQKNFDVLDTKEIIKECFMDLGLFPEDQRIPAASLVDMWVELHGEYEVKAMDKIYELATRNMVDIVTSRKVTSGTGNYNNHFVMKDDLLQKLAIHQSSKEPLPQRKRLIINIIGNDLPSWWTVKNEYPVAARILSMSTDELFTSDWCNLLPAEVEVLVLNFRAKKYALPKFIEKMRKLKVLLITNYSFYSADLENLELLNSLSNLRRIRLEQVSIPSLSNTRLQLKNLQKLSLFMCNVNQAFKNSTIQVSDMMPNLVEMNVDYCSSMAELPIGLCDIVSLKKLSITSCHKLSALPEGIGKLINLELLRLNSCTDLGELPDSVSSLQKLKVLDISDCISLSKLPEHMGKLCNLEELYIRSCSRISELPPSVMDLNGLKVVITDEEMVDLWEPFKHILSGLQVQVAEADFNLKNYGFHTTELKNFHLLGSLPNLKRIRLEKVSVPSLGTLKNLRKLSLYMLFGELLKRALDMVEKALNFKTTRRNLRTTLDGLTPVIQEMKAYNDSLDRPREEVGRVIEQLQACDELVRKYAKVPWWKSLSLPFYHDRLQEQDNKLVRTVTLDVQVQMARDVKETLHTVRDVLETLVHSGLGSIGGLVKGLCGAPENPKFTVGLDEPLKKIKIELLKEDASVHVLTGLPGSGKTTMAKKLCWDHDVKGKFGDNIFFVTFSKTPNLKSIVQTLFEHCGLRAPEFPTDEDAINRLGILLRKFGGRPILLVLDDVWQGSENLVEKFKFQISDYKVLVTSRFAFPRFVTSCHLNPLGHDDAIKLFRHFSLPNDGSYYTPEEKLVHEVVRGCKGSPLAIEVIGGLLCKQPFEVWEKMKALLLRQSIFNSNTDLLHRLQTSLEVLEDKLPVKKECFMDLGLFPEDQMIPVDALIDMWAEQYELGGDGIEAMAIIHELSDSNLVKTVVRRRVARDIDKYYNNHFVMLHDLLRELAIYQSSQEPFQERRRLIIDLTENNHPEWLSLLPGRWIEQEQQHVNAHTLSIYADETSTADWSNMQADKAEVLVLNLRSSSYTMPKFMETMSKLKALMVINYGFHLSELNKFELLGYLCGLKRVRLEKVLVPRLCKLMNLQKLSLHMCNIGQAFESCSINNSDALPNLVELSIDYCKDLVELPAGICKIISLKKLSITNCHKFSALPQEMEELKNLEMLRLSSCTNLIEINSISKLKRLCHLDISDCISLSKLPDDFGDLQKLEKLYMKGCSRCELPFSVTNLEQHLKVICDEETAASWETYQHMLPQLSVELLKEDINLDWLQGVGS